MQMTEVGSSGNLNLATVFYGKNCFFCICFYMFLFMFLAVLKYLLGFSVFSLSFNSCICT